MNEIYNVVGFRFYEFTPKDSNVTYAGTKLYLVSDDCTKGDMYGCVAESVNVSDNVEYDAHIGDRILISYNRYGKVCSVTLI